ncbi:MAG: T9SS type A sorting domain-containing protein [Bacteroidota bacterium]|nr:T9SS type A sorting domain-containing protein [Bacteroidota bacterium]
MSKITYIFLLVFVSVKGFSQAAATLFSVCTLPSVLNESSGIEKTGSNTFWSHNDSGGQPALYKFDSSGTLLKTLTISGATNFDWEDIAQDHLKNIYIGDFGNNNNDRSVANSNQLRIYKITDPDLIAGTSTTASIINFEYADRNFSAPAGNHNFDMEGFFFYNDSLHLFTKNRTSPTNGWIKHYILPSIAGTYSAMVVDSFNNAGVRICAADISPDKKRVALLANDRIWLFSCFKGSKFISTGTNTVLTLPLTQKEAVVFSTDSIIYITDELTGPIGQKLYRSNISASYPPPVNLNITSTNNLLCVGQSATLSVSGASTYVWNTSASGSSIIISPSLTTTYSLTGTASNGCQNTSSYTQSVSICNGLNIRNLIETKQINTYPNPFQSKFRVLTDFNIDSNIEVYNYLGQLIFSSEIINESNEIDLENFPSGIYTIRIKNSNNHLFKKVIKE